jgi:hypothetical protein
MKKMQSLDKQCKQLRSLQPYNASMYLSVYHVLLISVLLLNRAELQDWWARALSS